MKYSEENEKMTTHKEQETYHVPVLLQDSIDWLITDTEGIYIDVTFGGGGHSKAILAQLDRNASLMAFDQDTDTVDHLPNDDRFIFCWSNFAYLLHFVKYYGFEGKVNGVLADLGVSSHHFDEVSRGFTYRHDVDLDMRMNARASRTAADILAQYSAEELQRVFGQYGEIRNSKTLAKRIVESRDRYTITRTAQLEQSIRDLIRGDHNRYMAQLFQALRIEVNQELQVLEDMLTQAAAALQPGGRIVVISYHSLEDRVVKRFFKNHRTESDERYFKVLTNKPLEPSKQEKENNTRARSAKMRVAEKI